MKDQLYVNYIFLSNFEHSSDQDQIHIYILIEETMKAHNELL